MLRIAAGFVLCVSAILGLLHVAGFPPAEMGTDEGTELLDEEAGPGVRSNLLTMKVNNHSYDSKCQLLVVDVQIRNRSTKPVFLIANNFVFVREKPGTPDHRLMVETEGDLITFDVDLRPRRPRVKDRTKEDLITFDLSHLSLTKAGRGAMMWVGTPEMIDNVVRLEPESIWNAKYAFQFPLSIDTLYSNVSILPAPTKRCMVRLRFGWSTEPLIPFVKRLSYEANELEKYDRKIEKEWQNIYETAPFEVDFSK